FDHGLDDPIDSAICLGDGEKVRDARQEDQKGNRETADNVIHRHSTQPQPNAGGSSEHDDTEVDIAQSGQDKDSDEYPDSHDLHFHESSSLWFTSQTDGSFSDKCHLNHIGPTVNSHRTPKETEPMTTQSVSAALSLTAHPAENGPTGPSALARRLELSKATALRLLRTLEERGWVSQSPAPARAWAVTSYLSRISRAVTSDTVLRDVS